MDGVLVDVRSSWGLLHQHFGVSSLKNMIDYLEGRIDYREFIRRDIKLWMSVKGKIHVNEIVKVFNDVEVPRDSILMVKSIKGLGLRTAIVTSGINILAERLCRILGIDYCLSNGLVFDENGYLKCEGVPTVPPLEKDLIVYLLARSLGYNVKREVAYVGDGIFDVPVFKRVAVSIAFNANENVSRHAMFKARSRREVVEIVSAFTP